MLRFHKFTIGELHRVLLHLQCCQSCGIMNVIGRILDIENLTWNLTVVLKLGVCRACMDN
jgi:hypothetical protein